MKSKDSEFKAQQIRDILKIRSQFPRKSPLTEYMERERGGVSLRNYLGRMSRNLARLSKLNEAEWFQKMLKDIDNGILPF